MQARPITMELGMVGSHPRWFPEVWSLPFSLIHFLNINLEGTIQLDTPPFEVEVEDIMSLDMEDSPVKTFNAVGCQATRKAMNAETKHDPWNLRLGATKGKKDKVEGKTAKGAQGLGPSSKTAPNWYGPRCLELGVAAHLGETSLWVPMLNG